MEVAVDWTQYSENLGFKPRLRGRIYRGFSCFSSVSSENFPDVTNASFHTLSNSPFTKHQIMTLHSLS